MAPRRKSAIATLMRNPSMEQQRCCPVCYEDYDHAVESGIVCISLHACEHDFCRDCLKEHCLLTLQQHKPLPITCPASWCDQSISDKQLHDVLCNEPQCDSMDACTNQLCVKYQRRLQLQCDPSLVPCTKCEALLSSSEDETMTTHLHCDSCGHDFCKVHGDAHPDMTCEEYENRPPSAEQVASETTIDASTKPCPHCNARIELYGGCEHVVCSTCHNDFCYKCGRHEYLVGNSIRTCTYCRQSYMDHRKMEKQRVMTCLKLPLTLPLAILYLVIASASALASGCCCLCFGCGIFVGDDDELRPLSPRKGMRMTLIYIVWPLLDILTEFGVPVYNGWLTKGLEQELGIASSTDDDSTVASSHKLDDLSV